MCQREVEHRVESVDFNLEIVVAVAIGVDKYLEVVVVVDNGVAFRERGPYVGLFHHGCDIKVIVVPEHLGGGVVTRSGMIPATDVNKMRDVCRLLPGRFIEAAIDVEGRRRTLTYVLLHGSKAVGIAHRWRLLRHRRRAQQGAKARKEMFHNGYRLGVLSEKTPHGFLRRRPTSV